MVGVLAVGSRRHRKTKIKHAVARAGDNRYHCIENTPSLKIGVKALVNKLSQESSALRNTPRCSMVDARQCKLRELCIALATKTNQRNKVANRCHSCARQHRVLRFIDKLINETRLEPFLKH